MKMSSQAVVLMHRVYAIDPPPNPFGPLPRSTMGGAISAAFESTTEGE